MNFFLTKTIYSSRNPHERGKIEVSSNVEKRQSFSIQNELFKIFVDKISNEKKKKNGSYRTIWDVFRGWITAATKSNLEIWYLDKNFQCCKFRQMG